MHAECGSVDVWTRGREDVWMYTCIRIHIADSERVKNKNKFCARVTPTPTPTPPQQQQLNMSRSSHEKVSVDLLQFTHSRLSRVHVCGPDRFQIPVSIKSSYRLCCFWCEKNNARRHSHSLPVVSTHFNITQATNYPRFNVLLLLGNQLHG